MREQYWTQSNAVTNQNLRHLRTAVIAARIRKVCLKGSFGEVFSSQSSLLYQEIRINEK
jgi:hypothetical protein